MRRARAIRGDRGALEVRNASALDRESFRARVMHEHRAAIECRRNRRHEHRLLRVGRTAHAAVAEIRAAFHVARHDAGRNAERSCTALQHRVVRVGRDVPRSDGEPALDAIEPRREQFRRVFAQTVVLAPVCQRPRGRAKAARPIHDRRSTDRAALQYRDRAVFGFARGRLLIECRIGFALEHVKIARTLQRTFLDHHDAQAGACERLGRGRTAGAGSDDDRVGVELQVAVQRGCVANVPAAA